MRWNLFNQTSYPVFLDDPLTQSTSLNCHRLVNAVENGMILT